MTLISTSRTLCIGRFFSSQPLRENMADVFIVGAGCIGQSLAISLLKTNPMNRIFLQAKSQYIKDFQKTGINIKGAIEGTFIPNDKFRVIDVIDKNLFMQNKIKENLIIFSATKANQVASSLIPFRAIPGIRPTVICLQNGLGSELEVQRSFSGYQCNILKGHVLGAAHQKDSHLFAFKGKILVERGDEALSDILREMFRHHDQGIFSLEISGDIYRDIYPKVAVNCVCNPLTVILNQNLGFIREHYEPLIHLICNEIYTVATAQGILLISSQHLTEFVLNMMSKFSSHHSSMYLDHTAGRETEIDYINGGILQVAKQQGIQVPINQFLTKAIKEIQEKRASARSSQEFYHVHDLYLKDLINQLVEFSHTSL